jgi:hypothetical protein
VFPAQDDVHEFEKSDNSELSVHIRLGDLLPLVAMAQKMHFIWLKDFLDDEVCISADLHDVLQAFRGVRPPA